MSDIKVPAEQAEEKKKKKKLLVPILISAAVLLLGGTAGLLAGLGVFKGGSNETDDTEVVDDNIQLWWNVDKDQYAGKSEIGTSSRPTDKDDGYYHVLFATEGRQVTRRVAEKKLLNVIDSNDLMGLEFDEKGIVVGFKKVEDFTGGYEIAGWYVNEVLDDRTLLMNTANTLNGMDEEYRIPEDAIIYDVSGAVNFVGMEIKFEDLQQYDRIYAVKNLDDEIYRVFVTDRYVRPQIYWNVERQWNKELLATTRVPNAEGEYEFLMAHDGEQVIVKTKDRAVANAIDQQAAKCVGLTFDPDGYAIKSVSASKATGGGSFGSWYHILEMDGLKVKAKKIITASDTGKEAEGELAPDYRAYDVSGDAEFVGVEIFDLKESDQIHGLKDNNGKICIVYVVGRLKDSEIYWNLDRQYDSTNKVTKRVPAADGYYHFKLAVGGVQKEFITSDKELATKIDAVAARCFGLKVNGNVIEKMYSASSVTGAGSAASWYDVLTFDGTNFKAKKTITASDTGKEYEGPISPDCKVYNVSDNVLDHKGEITKLMVGDRIHGLKNLKGEVSVIFVVNRPVQSEIYWNITRMYDSTNKVTKRTPDANGYYNFDMVVNGKNIVLRTKDKAVASEVDSYAVRTMGLRLNGDIILKTYAPSSVTATSGGSVASWYDVMSISGNTYHMKKNAAGSDQGKEVDMIVSPNAKIMNVGGLYTVIGEYTKLQVGDRVQGWKNKNGVADYVFIVARKAPDKKGLCVECGEEVTWQAASATMVAQTDAAGNTLPITHVYVPTNMALSGQASTPSVQVDGAYKTVCDVHFDLCGYTATAAANARFAAAFGDKTVLTIFDSSEKKTGKIVSGAGRPADKGAFMWAMNNCKIIIKDVTLDMSGLNAMADKSYGGIYLTGSSAGVELNNVKIKAGAGLNGSVVYATAGKVVLNDVTVEGGTTGDNGTFYMRGTSVLQLNGKTSISGGKLADGTTSNIYVAENAKLDTTGLTCADGAIGVRTEKAGAFSTANFAGLASKFKADVEGGKIVEDGGVLYMEYHISGIAFDSENVSVELGQSTSMPAKTTPVAMSNVNITYESSDPSKVMVDSKGNVVALAETTTPVTITAKITTAEGDTFTATSKVTVTPATKPLTHYHAEATNADMATNPAKISYTAWTSATSMPKDSGYYYLDTDVTLTAQGSMPEGQVLHLCLNGHTISADPSVARTLSVFNTGAELFICDCSEGETGMVKAPEGTAGASNQGRAVWARYGNFHLFGGTIYGGYTTQSSGGGAVNIGAGNIFNMYGGTITGGVSNTHGGNLAVTGTANIYGGKIVGGKSGFVMNADGSVEKLTGSSTPWKVGGNIYANGEVNIYGGEILDGESFYAGNIYNLKVLNIEGTETAPVIIKGGKARYGGNIWVDKAPETNITYAEISDGNAPSYANIFTQGMAFTLKNSVIGAGTATTHSVGLAGGANTIENTEIKAVTYDTAATWMGGGLMLLQSSSQSEANTTTIKDSSIAMMRVASAINKVTLAGKVEIGNTASNGIYVENVDAGNKIEIDKATFDTTSKINVRAKDDGTIVKNGAAYIDNFTQLNGADWELKADADELILTKGAPAQKHIHCVCGEETYAGEGHTCDKTVEWTAWSSDTELPTANGYYYLTGDVNLAALYYLKPGMDVTICLNGYNITINNSTKSRVVSSYSNSAHQSGAKLTFTDCAATPGAIVNPNMANTNDGGVLWSLGANELNMFRITVKVLPGATNTKSGVVVGIGNSTVFNMYSGTIEGGTVKGANTTIVTGGAIMMTDNAVFNMYGGTIKGGSAIGEKAWTSGGNVYIKGKSTFNMYGGTIEGGSVSGDGSGGNIGVTATFNMYGGTIKNGTSGSAGGNIWADSGSIINIQGGTIEGGKSAGLGGNIYSKSTQDNGITIANATIKNGEAGLEGDPWVAGGNIYVGGNVKMTVKDTEISGGKSLSGGNMNLGMSTAGTGAILFENVVIKDGEALKNAKGQGGQGGNIYVDAHANVTFKNCTITGGKATSAGGSIYTKSEDSIVFDGETEISGGTLADGTANNLTVRTPATAITLGADFKTKSGAPIGVNMTEPGVFTTNAGNVADFVSDGDSVVTANGEGKLMLSAASLTGIELNKTTVTLQPGSETETLVVSLVPTGSAYETVTWETSADAIVTVEQNTVKPLEATITKVAEGTATITVTVTAEGVADPFTATCEVTVKGAHKHAIATNAKILAGEGDEVEWTDLNATIKAIRAANTAYTSNAAAMTDLPEGNYYLSANLSLGAQMKLPEGKTYAFCLNGYAMTSTSRAVVTFNTDTKISVCDCSADETGTITGTFKDQGAGLWVRYGVIDLYGGTVTGSTAGKNGAGVYVTAGINFTMYGGTLSGNSATLNGGNMYIAEDSSILGGIIKNGVAEKGGNILVYTDKTLKLDNVEIFGGKNTAGDAEDIYLASGALLDIGTILGTNEIVVKMTTPGVLSKNVVTEETAARFVSGNAGYVIVLNEDGKLEMKAGVTAVAFDEEEIEVGLAEEEIQFTATPADGIISSVEWESSDETVLTVAGDEDDDTKAVISPKAEGEAIVTVTVNGNVTAELKVTVSHTHCECGGSIEDGTVILEGATEEESLKHECDVQSYKAWDKTDRLPYFNELEDGDNYFYLTKDITLTNTWYPAYDADTETVVEDMAGKYLTICLNGHTIESTALRMISTLVKVNADNSQVHTANVAICFTDCAETPGTIKVSGDAGSNQGAFAWMCGENNVLGLYNITVDGSEVTTTAKGGLIALSGNASFAMMSGTIKGAKGSGYGMTIGLRDKAQMVMVDGEIIGNTVTGYSAGIYVTGDATVMQIGGTIKGGNVDTTATWKIGGNVYIDSDNAKYMMLGGEITGGRATHGGNVGIERGTFMMTGGKITDGESYYTGTIANTNVGAVGGGNVMVNKGVLIMTDGEITGGKALRMGGNVLVSYTDASNFGQFIMTGGKIADGTVHSKSTGLSFGGNVASRGFFYMEDGEISGGLAAENTKSSANTVNAGVTAQGYGGNIGILGGVFQLYGGVITKGKSAVGGGNIFIRSYQSANPANVELTGGKITEGASWSGGAIRMQGDSASIKATLTVGGDVEFSGNYANSPSGFGSGILVYNAYATLNLTGAPVFSGNKNSTAAAVESDIQVNGAILNVTALTTTETIKVRYGIKGDNATDHVTGTLGKADADYTAVIEASDNTLKTQFDGTNLKLVTK